MTFALFRDGRQISKAHSTKDAVLVEAIDHGLVMQAGLNDFGDHRRGNMWLAAGCEIREVK